VDEAAAALAVGDGRDEIEASRRAELRPARRAVVVTISPCDADSPATERVGEGGDEAVQRRRGIVGVNTAARSS
jgi:hypothetical protein